MNRFNAIVFDMDGLLLDTETIAISSFLAACRECNFEPDLKVYYRCIGTTYARTREILMEGYGRDFPYEIISKRWNQIFKEEAENKIVPLKAGALDLLQYLEEKGLKSAVVTSTRQSTALKELNNAQILPFFDFVLGGDQISHGKPDPEIYLRACAQLSEDPSKCLALEDSDNGVQSAFAAGLAVIQVPDILEPSPEVKALGHQVVKSLSEVEVLIRRASG